MGYVVIAGSNQCRFRGQSGHGLVRRTCPLMTKADIRPDQRLRPVVSNLSLCVCSKVLSYAQRQHR